MKIIRNSWVNLTKEELILACQNFIKSKDKSVKFSKEVGPEFGLGSTDLTVTIYLAEKDIDL